MCYQRCRYEDFTGECSLKSDTKPPIDAMCSINDLGAEIAALRELVKDMWHEGAFEPGASYVTEAYGLAERTRELGIEVAHEQ